MSPSPDFPEFSSQMPEAPGNVLPFVDPQVIENLGIPHGDDLEELLAKAFLADHNSDPCHPYHPSNLARLQKMLKNGEGNGGKIIEFAIPK